MSSIKTTMEGYVRYRGREGQLSFMLHRLTGLGVLLFLAIHILDTATVYFFPSLYEHAIAIYRTTIFGIAEIGLVFAVLYHGANGIRIAVFDWFPKLWTIERQRRIAVLTLIFTIIIWLPLVFIMVRNILIHNFGMFGG
jgi:succinate dehydrogenase / fumarate reductase, cytochrome b subunit